MAVSAGAYLGGAAIGGASGLGGSTNGFSDSSSLNNSWGSGGSWNQSNSSTSAYGYTDNQSSSWSNQEGQSWSTTYGREASAQDLYNATLANQIQASLWQDQAKYNAEQAEVARAWEEKMSNTAYQRAVADLKAAGLNPILAAMNMGASTPSAVSATSGLATAHKANAYAQSESYSYNKGSSGSKSKTKSENWSNGESTSSGGSSENYGSTGQSNSHSEQTTQLKSLIDGVKTIFKNGNSGKSIEHKSATGGKHGGRSMGKF